MAKDDKFAKEIGDEQLDKAAGGAAPLISEKPNIIKERRTVFNPMDHQELSSDEKNSFKQAINDLNTKK